MMATREEDHLAFADHVHHVLIAGEFILLDEKRDRYFLLDESDSEQLLSSLVSGTISEALLKCRSAGLMALQEKPQCINIFSSRQHGIGNHVWANVENYRRDAYGRSKFILALLLISCTKIWISIFGFGSTVKLARRLTVRAPRKEEKSSVVDSKRILQMAAAIYRAGLRFPCKIQCLESSLALYGYASLANIRTTFKVGVQRYDFLAHAWIEIDDRVIADDPALSIAMPTILRIEPRLIR